MPAPAVYVAVAVGAITTVAAAIAFKEFVYEPHIAPKIEAWAESFLEGRRQRRRRRQGPVATQPHDATQDGRDENRARRSGDPFADQRGSDDEGGISGAMGASVELEQLVSQEVNGWRNNVAQPGLRQRRRTAALDDSNVFIPYSPVSPTHVIFDSSVPSSPLTASDSMSQTSSPRSSRHGSVHRSPVSPAHPLSGSHRSPRVISPRLPTPISNSLVSSRMQTPTMTDVGSPVSIRSRASTPAMSEVNLPQSMYNTAIMDVSEQGRVPAAPAQPLSRALSPFSDAYSAATFSSGMGSPSIASDIELPSDDEFDVLSPRSGMFSLVSAQEVVAPQPHFGMLAPGAAHEATVSGVRSPNGSEASWASVGRRSPEF